MTKFYKHKIVIISLILVLLLFFLFYSFLNVKTMSSKELVKYVETHDFSITTEAFFFDSESSGIIVWSMLDNTHKGSKYNDYSFIYYNEEGEGEHITFINRNISKKEHLDIIGSKIKIENKTDEKLNQSYTLFLKDLGISEEQFIKMMKYIETNYEKYLVNELIV